MLYSDEFFAQNPKDLIPIVFDSSQSYIGSLEKYFIEQALFRINAKFNDIRSPVSRIPED